MNYNRRRNIFTLGDFQQYPNPTHQIKAQHNRRQNSDPFERDPFKIQSYNFRYAERPSYPLANCGNNRAQRSHHHSPPSSTSSHKRFETFFYNYDFTPSVHDKENPPANKFREFRRRKFLLDHQQHHPATACMFAPAADCRGSSTLQQQSTMCEHLHPNAHSAGADASARYARVGTSASQTDEYAPTVVPVAAATDADASGSGCRRRAYGNVDNDGRHHQTLGSATDTSSIGTAAGLRSAAREYVSTSSHMSTATKCGRNTAARSTGNREYLRALATAHIGASAAQPINYLGRGRSSSRSSVERGRRLRVEPLGGGGVGVGQKRNHCFGGASTGSADFRELSNARAPSAKYARQSVHSTSPHRVTATVEKTESGGACSGCQININIKGLDSTQLGDNVVIKIESDKNSPNKIISKTEQLQATNNIYNANSNNVLRNDIAIAKLVEIKRNSEMSRNLDSKPKAMPHQHTPNVRNSSSASFVIDKRLSKFAMNSNDEREQRKFMPRSSSHSRVPITSSTTRAMGFNTSSTPIRASNSSEGINRSARSVSKERMPSMVPWCLDTTIRHGLMRENDDARSLRAQASNLIKHATRPSYDATLNDLRKMRRQAVVAAYKPFSLQRASASLRKAENVGSGAAAGNSKVGEERERLKKSSTPTTTNTDGVQRRQSHHSLRSLKASKSTVNSQFDSQVELVRSPTMILRRSRSSTRPAHPTEHATESQSHVSVRTTPLNVNINVFADKLKLLRV